jgi:dihydrolipoamide dehydrogenase
MPGTRPGMTMCQFFGASPCPPTTSQLSAPAPGGYVCAIRAAQLGLKVAVVEKDKTFGGTCLNVGCIPSKALLHASHLFEEAGHGFEKMGIKVSSPKLDLAAMQKFKDEGVDGNVKGVAFLFKKNKIDAFIGHGTITAPGKIEVKGATARRRRSRRRTSSSRPARMSRG